MPAKTYLGIWLAHTGFGLPLAIYLLRNYMAGLPREIMESARVDGASDFEIFVKIVLPLSFPALASFAIFQFLWVWNDLLVAMVFLGRQRPARADRAAGQPARLARRQLGNPDGSAFITIVVPLIVFFACSATWCAACWPARSRAADHHIHVISQDNDMSMTIRIPSLTVDKDWWRGAVIYQIYPRSFQDSNGDGIGDLKGITARLPHVASLGVDAIWISPFFTSPMRDFGYDVSTMTDVDPIFGTLADFDALIAEAHRLGIRVMIDLVLSHTSDQHPWFAESRSSRFNPKADWYVWADAKPDGTPPNNWLSIFGGSAWAWDPTRMQYYMHNFLTSQPDLNLHNPEVQDALLDVDALLAGARRRRLPPRHDQLLFPRQAAARQSGARARNGATPSTAPAVNPYNLSGTSLRQEPAGKPRLPASASAR